MTQFIIILLVFYVLYYAGNIVYDLFLKKETALKTEDSEEFSLVDYDEKIRADVETIGIEDVENLTTPKSFNKKEFFQEPVFTEERESMEHWRERFESEQDIDSFDEEKPILKNAENQNETELDETTEDPEDEHEYLVETAELLQKQAEKEEFEFKKLQNQKQFKKMVSLAETIVQVVEDIKGQKVYN